MLLEVNNVTKHFGGLAALSGVSFKLEEGCILGLIGPNGAGKTTLFNCLAGTLRVTSGSVLFDGIDITGMKPFMIARLGLARSYQISRPFGSMTTLQNAMVGGFRGNRSYDKAESIATETLELVRLSGKKDIAAKHLNIGELKKLELAKALATRPRLLLLDEVMAGLTPAEVIEMAGIIKIINNSGVTLIIIEHIMEAVMSLSKRILALNFGEKIAEGTPSEVSANKEVIEAYFGSDEG